MLAVFLGQCAYLVSCVGPFDDDEDPNGWPDWLTAQPQRLRNRREPVAVFKYWAWNAAMMDRRGGASAFIAANTDALARAMLRSSWAQAGEFPSKRRRQSCHEFEQDLGRRRVPRCCLSSGTVTARRTQSSMGVQGATARDAGAIHKTGARGYDQWLGRSRSGKEGQPRGTLRCTGEVVSLT